MEFFLPSLFLSSVNRISRVSVFFWDLYQLSFLLLASSLLKGGSGRFPVRLSSLFSTRHVFLKCSLGPSQSSEGFFLPDGRLYLQEIGLTSFLFPPWFLSVLGFMSFLLFLLFVRACSFFIGEFKLLFKIICSSDT